MNNLKPTFALVVICSLFIPSISFSRQVEDWSYERLFKESDLVVIAHVQGWGVTKKEWNEKFFDKARFEGAKTIFGASQVPRAVRLNTNIGLAPPSADTNATGPLPIA